MSKPILHNNVPPFLADGGEAAELILKHDWSQTSLPAIDEWPLSLQITLGNILHSGFPMLLFWGKDLICFYNDAFRPSLGSEGRHPAIGKKGYDVWKDVWEFTGPLLAGVMKTGKPVYYEDQLVPFYRNGRFEDIYWTFSYSPAYNDSGKIVGVLVTCIETTKTVLERKMVDRLVIERTKQLQIANEYLQNIINLFREPLQVLEPVFVNGQLTDFRYKITNAVYAEYANTTPDELQGKKVGDIFPGYFETSSFSKLVDAFTTGEPQIWDIHYHLDDLDLYNKMSAVKIGQELVVHFTDLSEIKHLQFDLERKITQLQRSNENLEEFAYAASHDLKEPIRKISVFIDQLKTSLDGRLEEDEIRIFKRVELASERMKLLVDDLLRYTHLSEIPAEMELVDLDGVIKQALHDLELDIEQKDAIITNDACHEVKGYRRQLQQLFQNLISNGLKYSKADVPPRINIDCHDAVEDGKKYHLIKVSDNGIGFEQKYAEQIFEMFVRLHGRSEYSGTGIGLSIVKKIVDNHSGMIKTESEPDKGTTFMVYLPYE